MKKITFLIFWFFAFTLNLKATPKIDSLLTELDQVLQKKEVYVSQKWERINELTRIISKNKGFVDSYYRYSIYSKLLNEYKSFNYDSSFIYAKKMIQIAYQTKNQAIIDDAKINTSFVLLSSGLFHESLDTLLSVDPTSLPETLKITYYKTLNRAWIDLSDYAQDEFYSKIYNQRGNVALINAISISDSGTSEFNFLKGLYYLRNTDHQKSRFYYEQLLMATDLPLDEQAKVASSLSYIYKTQGEVDKSIEQLVKAAIIDIQLATKETIALTNLAEALFLSGNEEFALKSVTQALADANFYGARHRKVQISNVLPIIESSILLLNAKERQVFQVSSIILTVMVMLLLVLAVIVGKQNKNLKRTKKELDLTITHLKNSNQKLGEANRIKEEYIGHFFNLISNYIEKIEKMKKTIIRKISLNQHSDIDTIARNIDLVQEREALYSSFDSIFMKMFPKFIEKFNLSVGFEDRVLIDQGMPFSPELRIFALKRLGINDNEKIAKFLGYTVTTIYTYKTKLKKRSLNPNINLEDTLMHIQME